MTRTQDASKDPYAARMRDAPGRLLAVTWDYLEDCATKDQLREAAIRPRVRITARWRRFWRPRPKRGRHENLSRREDVT
jgi:hypothetical protein